MSPTSGRAPPPAPVEIALVALAVPLLSQAVAAVLTIFVLTGLGVGDGDEILAHLSAGGDDAMAELATQIASLFFELMLLGATLAFARRRREGRDYLFGWVPWSGDRSFLPFFVLMLAWQVFEAFFIEPRFPELAALSHLPYSQPARLISLVTVAVAAPFAEEIFFRGFLFGALRAYAGFRTTIILTSAYFAAWHYTSSLVIALITFPFGLIAGLARERYGSVRPAIYLHVAWNLIAWGSDYLSMAQ